MQKKWPIGELKKIYKRWTSFYKKQEVETERHQLVILEAGHLIDLYDTGDAVLIENFRKILQLHKTSIATKAQRASSELAVKYKTQVRRDSIANLSFRSATAEAKATTRTSQLWLLATILAALSAGLLFVRRESRRRKSLNEVLLVKNNQITRLNHEINHRTANNLNSIIFLLKDQKRIAFAKNIDVSVIENLERKILAFTKMQRRLNSTLAEINLQDYMDDFCEHLREIFANSDQQVHFNRNIANINVSPDFAAPLALIINELATNSLKYARREKGVLSISLDAILDEAGELHVYYRDGGPADGPIHTETHSSGQGMELVRGFTEQLEGQIIRYGDSEEGFNYEAIFTLAA